MCSWIRRWTSSWTRYAGEYARSSVTALGKVERALERGGAQFTAAKIADGQVLLDGDALYDLLEAASESAGLPQVASANAQPTSANGSRS
jgi:hypothetical protein